MWKKYCIVKRNLEKLASLQASIRDDAQHHLTITDGNVYCLPLPHPGLTDINSKKISHYSIYFKCEREESRLSNFIMRTVTADSTERSLETCCSVKDTLCGVEEKCLFKLKKYPKESNQLQI